ncbi:MAG: hypothetical protein NZ553_06310 [Caldilinea sp.]|nr:hypothetical protein [Caldilinea sp.]MDW8440063.1 hypothetical protein [Caldilineaceae bacterium]
MAPDLYRIDKLPAGYGAGLRQNIYRSPFVFAQPTATKPAMNENRHFPIERIF